MADFPFIRSATKKSLLGLFRRGEFTPRIWARLIEAIVTKDELEVFITGGSVYASDVVTTTTNFDGILSATETTVQKALDVLDDIDYADISGNDAATNVTAAELEELSDGSVTTLHDHDVTGLTNWPTIDYSYVSGNDAATDVTAVQLEELSDGSTTTLHNHAYKQLVCLTSYIDVKERGSEWNLHGGLSSLDTGSPLDSTPTDITVTAGIGKLVIVVNAGTDLVGDITVTGTSVNRDTGAETAADTDTITVDALTTDGSDTDAEGNIRHSFTGAYITSKWFKGSVTLSTTDLTLTDVDTYQVAFEQMNDDPNVEMLTADMTAFANNSSAWLYGYLYLLEVTGDKCDISRRGSLELPAADVSANKYYRIRRGSLGVTFDGTTDGFWADIFPGPLNQNYWEDVNIKFWFNLSETT